MTDRHTQPRVLLLMGTSHGYGRLLIDGITQYLYEHGCNVDFELRGHLEPIPPWVKNWRGDGIIVRHNAAKTFELLERMKIPYIRLNCPDHPSDIDVDEDALGELAVRHFMERGVQNFAFFSQCDHYWTQRRCDGFLRQVHRVGKECSVFVRPSADTAPFLTWEPKLQAKLIRWLHELPKPVGLLASYDFHARQVMEVCQSEGIAIPNEISVLGINNEEWFCRIQNPPLSSIIQNGLRAGYEAARLLCLKMEGKPLPPLPVLFPPIGVETRISTDLIAVQDEDAAEALRFIRREGTNGISIDEIVEHIGLSRRTLERKYRQEFGRTLGEDLMRIKIERAKTMLRETDFPIGNIAIQLGFCSHAYFIHVFRQISGVTPTEFRKNVQ